MAAPVPLPFAQSERSTVGIEWEVALVDADSGDLRQAAQAILATVRPADGTEHPHITQELLLNTVEVRSGKCRTIAEATGDLQRALDEVAAAAAPLRIELMGGATHPFAQLGAAEGHRQAAVRHAHRPHPVVGPADAHLRRARARRASRTATRCCRSPARCSRSSRTSSRCRRRRPFWGGKDTGYASNRALLFQQLPTAGLPSEFDEWSQLEQYVGDMMHTGVIDQFDEVRWDVRPAPRFGTLEMRIADGASNLLEVAAISALTHCFVEHFSTMLDRGETLPTLPPWFAQENKWRSARYGMDAIIITNAAGDEELVTDAVGRWLIDLAPVAERLGCAAELEQVRVILRRGASYQRQRAVARRHAGELDAVVRSLVAELKAGRPL